MLIILRGMCWGLKAFFGPKQKESAVFSLFGTFSVVLQPKVCRTPYTSWSTPKYKVRHGKAAMDPLAPLVYSRQDGKGFLPTADAEEKFSRCLWRLNFGQIPRTVPPDTPACRTHFLSGSKTPSTRCDMAGSGTTTAAPLTPAPLRSHTQGWVDWVGTGPHAEADILVSVSLPARHSARATRLSGPKAERTGDSPLGPHRAQVGRRQRHACVCQGPCGVPWGPAPLVRTCAGRWMQGGGWEGGGGHAGGMLAHLVTRRWAVLLHVHSAPGPSKGAGELAGRMSGWLSGPRNQPASYCRLPTNLYEPSPTFYNP